jgi:hypothetical protein
MLVSKNCLLYGQKEAHPRGLEGGRVLTSGVKNFFLSLQPPPNRRQARIPCSFYCRGGRQRGNSSTDGWSEVVLKWFEWNDWLLVEVALLLIGLTLLPFQWF